MSVECKPIINCSTRSEYTYCKEFVHATPNELPPTELADQWKISPCFMPAKYARFANAILNFEVRKDDIWICTYAKCGTSWTQEMVWMLNNNLDYEADSRINMKDRYCFLEAVTMFDTKIEKENNEFAESSVEKANQMPSPRFIKSHLPAQLLPRQLWTVKPKIIYTSRNPKDTAISFYHHYRNIKCYKGSFSEYMEAFLANQVIWTPFHEHIVNFWTMRNEENILFITYENMKVDLISVVKKTMHFLGKSFSDDQLEKLCAHLDVNSMRNNPSINQDILVQDVLDVLGETKPDPDFRYFNFFNKNFSHCIFYLLSSDRIDLFARDWQVTLRMKCHQI